MANFKNTENYKVTTSTTVPAPANGIGTIETKGKGVIGTGTAFLSELRRGYYLVDTAANEIRIVDTVESDEFAILREAFTVDIAALSTPSIIDKKSMNIRTLSVGIASGLADGTINGVVFTNGTSYTFDKGGDSKDNFKNFVEPILVDGTGTSIDVVIMR